MLYHGSAFLCKLGLYDRAETTASS